MQPKRDIVLTRAEELIMQVLWQIERGVVRDIIEKLPDPKPAYNTVSTIIRILESKGIVSHKAFGKTHEYFPIISKDEYSKKFIKGFLSGYFNNSFHKMVSFFTENEAMDIQELEKTLKIMQDQVNQKKKEKL